LEGADVCSLFHREQVKDLELPLLEENEHLAEGSITLLGLCIRGTRASFSCGIWGAKSA
jgi:hypothetical protein